MKESNFQEKVRKPVSYVARIIALIAILAFFLPYASCSVGSTKIDVSLADIAVGADKEVGVSIFGYSESETIPMDAHPVLFLLLLLPAAALAFSWFKNQITRGGAYLVESIVSLLYNNFVMREIQSEMSYGAYDFSSYVLKKEIGYSLYQLHSWIMLLLGIGTLACWYYFASKQKAPLAVASDSIDKSFENSNKKSSSSESARRPSESCPAFSADAVASPASDKAESTTPPQKHSEASKPTLENASKLITSFSSRKSVGTESDSSTHPAAKSNEAKASDDSPFSSPTGF